MHIQTPKRVAQIVSVGLKGLSCYKLGVSDSFEMAWFWGGKKVPKFLIFWVKYLRDPTTRGARPHHVGHT